ncbi:BTAD domain-containing putative transcriptional regulator [Dactylosporangium sp. NPDC005555]|uniref:AfsR/SARP family transcriptional regulator n=1 Tax=Dactylosporangium sp. NPDC005555 TaxID=3154889 RepID=UPI0033B7256C
MRYRLLGPLAVDVGVGADGRPVEVPAARDRVLLAMLLLAPNRVVSVARLVDAVWGDAAPATARAQLHTCVSRLRRLLPDLIRTDAGGYRADVADGDLDTVTFTVGVAAARTAAAAGDLRQAQTRFRAALDLWRGPALAGVDSPAVQAHAVAFEERRDTALEDCVDVELRLGLHTELIGQLTALVEQYPLRERLTGQLMTALTRAGRTADALAVYRRLARALDDDLGLTPSDRLRRLHHDLLQPNPDASTPPNGLPAAGIAAAARPARPARTPVRPWTLPREVADHAGRDDLIAELVATSTPTPTSTGTSTGTGTGMPVVVCVDGMAGVGKTSLAVHVAHRVAGSYPDGRLFLDLRAHSDRPPLLPHDALGLLLGHLGVEPARIPADPDERVARWRSELADRRVLVVLDNAADTAQVQPLLPGASASLVIVTSRRRIAGLDAVHPVSLDVLSPAEARRLITAVVGARAVADPAATAQVADLCGYLPLALRLAAARLAHRPSWTVADLADRLRRAHPAPVDLNVDGRSPHAAFELSYRQLPPPAQRLFRLLGVHPAGELSLRVAAALDASGDTDDLLAQLVDAHLLNEPVAGRFRFHDLLREYAAHLAGTDPERDPATVRMFDFYLHATAAATKVWENNRDRDPVDFTDVGPHIPAFTGMLDSRRWLHLEWVNVVGVAHLADRLRSHRYTVLLTRALWAYLFRNSMNDVSLDLHRRALTAAQALGDADLTAMSRNYLASAHARGGDLNAAADHLRLLVGHPRWGVRAESNLAFVYLNVGRFHEALTLTQRSLHAGDDRWQVSVQWTALAGLLRALGRFDESVLVAQRIVAYGRANRITWSSAVGAVELGAARARLGQHRHAVRLLSWARRQLGDDAGPGAEIEARSGIGASLVALGDVEEGLELLRTAYDDGQHLDPTAACLSGNTYGEALRTLGRIEEGKLVHARVLERAMRIQHRYEQARAYRGLGLCSTDPRLARDRLTAALDLFEAMGTPERHEVRAALAALPPP